MAQYREFGNMGFISTNDLSAATNLNKLVKFDAANPGQIVLAAAATDQVIGTLLDTPGAGQTGTVRLLSSAGTIPVQYGGTVAAGDILVANTSGQAVTATQTVAGSQPTQIIVGRAIEAGAAGENHEVMAPASAIKY